MQSDGQDGQVWDDSLQSFEEVEARKLNKQEAAVKRERALAYAFSHQVCAWILSVMCTHIMMIRKQYLSLDVDPRS